MRLTFCEDCVRKRAHCCQCGLFGIDKAYNDNHESNGKHPYKWRAVSLWPCGQGCHNLVCTRCGTAYDGCQLHARTWPCTTWYSHFPPKRFQGTLFKDTLLDLTPEEAATWWHYQQRLANGGSISSSSSDGAPVALALENTQLEYAPQVVPAPVMLDDGATLYPGETTGLVTDPTALVGNPSADTSGNCFDTVSQCSTASSTAGLMPFPLCQQQFCHPQYGYKLTSYIHENEVWLHDEVLNAMHGWALQHPDYHSPQVGIPQREVNALAAVEISRRADADAQHYAEKAHAAEMVATEKAQAAKEATRKEKEEKAAALEVAEAKEVEAAILAQVHLDQANADAVHRRARADIASAAANRAPVTHASAPEPIPPPEANVVPADTNQALAPPLDATPASNFAAPPLAANTAIQPTCPAATVPNRFGDFVNCMAFTRGNTPARRS